jgi:hypothetical protein
MYLYILATLKIPPAYFPTATYKSCDRRWLVDTYSGIANILDSLLEYG